MMFENNWIIFVDNEDLCLRHFDSDTRQFSFLLIEFYKKIYTYTRYKILRVRNCKMVHTFSRVRYKIILTNIRYLKVFEISVP